MGQRSRRLIIYTLILSAVVLLAQSCSVFKDCGCGNDVNRAYKAPRNLR